MFRSNKKIQEIKRGSSHPGDNQDIAKGKSKGSKNSDVKRNVYFHRENNYIKITRENFNCV